MSNLTVCFTHTARLACDAATYAARADVYSEAGQNPRAEWWLSEVREKLELIRKEMNEAEAELNRLFPAEDAA